MPAGQQVNLALAAALLSGIRPTAITVDLAHDGTPAALTIDTPRGTEIKDTHRVFEALGITDPAVLHRPESSGRTRVDIDDSDSFGAPFGRLGIPITITVDAPTTSAAAEHSTVASHEDSTADVIDLAAYRPHRHTTRDTDDDTDTDTDEASTTRSGDPVTENTTSAQASYDDGAVTQLAAAAEAPAATSETAPEALTLNQYGLDREADNDSAGVVLADTADDAGDDDCWEA